MKKTLYILLIVATLSPFAAYAQIQSTTEAEADTGGNTGGQGGIVETGSSGSSVKTTNVVGSEGGMVDIEIRTEVNGEVKTESIKKEVTSGGVDVNVSAGASNTSKTEARGEVKVVINGAPVGTSSARFWEKASLPTWFWRSEAGDISPETSGDVPEETEELEEESTPSLFSNLGVLIRKLFAFLPFF